jgi:hypothetical protein
MASASWTVFRKNSNLICHHLMDLIGDGWVRQLPPTEPRLSDTLGEYPQTDAHIFSSATAPVRLPPIHMSRPTHRTSRRGDKSSRGGLPGPRWVASKRLESGPFRIRRNGIERLSCVEMDVLSAAPHVVDIDAVAPATGSRVGRGLPA